MIQIIAVIIIIAAAVFYIVRKSYKKINQTEGCEKGGCNDCPIKKECKKN